MNALIVDDSKAMRTILGKILKGLGFEITEATNGAEGVKAIGVGSPPDLVLVDWNMPEMNGLEFVRAVRSMRSLDAVRLVMVTTETESDRIMQALESGANEYIMKPFTAEVLQQKLVQIGLVCV
jgi:two-component system, chemotaxis family, chemotaxis protein CheY